VQAIHLTDAGRALAARVTAVADELNERTFAALDDAEREQLQALLLRVAEALTD
jgi:DNA-binding MarR family transcriptional regulator